MLNINPLITNTPEYQELSYNLTQSEMIELINDLLVMQDDLHIMHCLRLRCDLLVDNF